MNVSDIERTIDVLTGLLEWAESIGGWEAPIWEQARNLRDDLVQKRDTDTPLNDLMEDTADAIFRAMTKSDCDGAQRPEGGSQ